MDQERRSDRKGCQIKRKGEEEMGEKEHGDSILDGCKGRTYSTACATWCKRSNPLFMWGKLSLATRPYWGGGSSLRSSKYTQPPHMLLISFYYVNQLKL